MGGSLNMIKHPSLQPLAMLGYLINKARMADDLAVVLSFLPEKPVDEMGFTWDEVQPTAGGMTPKANGLGSALLNKHTTVTHVGMTDPYREQVEIDPRRMGGKDVATIVREKLDILFDRLTWRQIYEVINLIRTAAAANPQLTPIAPWSNYEDSKPLRDIKAAKSAAKQLGVVIDSILISDEAEEHLTENNSIMKLLSNSRKDQLLATGSIGRLAGCDIFPVTAEVIGAMGAVDLMNNSMYGFKRGSSFGETFVSMPYNPKSKQEDMGGQPVIVEVEKHFKCKLVRPWGLVETTDLYPVT